MTLPILHLTWSFGTNNRIPYVSLNDLSAKLFFGIKNFLVAGMGWTVKYTCDGTTGPTSSTDHTDRLSSAANCTTQGATPTAAQSFAVLTNGVTGEDFLFAFQGASADTFKLSMSAGGLFLPAGTANQQPTATDETIFLPNTTSWVGATTSGDRMWHIMATTNKTSFRVFTYRASAMIYAFGAESVRSAVTAVIWTPPTVAWATNTSTPNTASGGHALASAGSLGNQGNIRIGGSNVAVGGGGEIFSGVQNANVFIDNNMPLEAAAAITGLGFYSAVVSFQGKVGDRPDCYFVWSNAIAQGDTFGVNQWVYFATSLWPWNGDPVIIA